MDRERKCEDFTKAPICLRASSTYGCRLLDAVFANGRQRTPTKAYRSAPVRIKLRTPMVLRSRCNFVRLKDQLQLLNVPQICASHGPSYRAHPRLYLRSRAGAWRMSGPLRVQPLGEVN